jgi:hypothetical protein
MKRKIHILAFNGFPFHYEMIGFILDFCQKYDYEITTINAVSSPQWMSFYKSKYIFHQIYTLPSKQELVDKYDVVLLLTDDDYKFPNFFINFQNTYCIDHHYSIRRPQIKYEHHIPISPFFSRDVSLYALPIFDYIDLERKQQNIDKNKKPIITFLGDTNIPFITRIHSIIINTEDFDIYVINRTMTEINDSLPENVHLFENIDSTLMFQLLSDSSYMGFLVDPSHEQYQCFRSTATIPISFTTGCKLFLPKNMNQYLKLTSIIEYDSIDIPFSLPTDPSLETTFQERKRLLSIRDECLHKTFHL